MARKWKPSRTKAKEFAVEMEEIRKFCDKHRINYSRSMDSYYFYIDDVQYRVSNHTMEASNKKAVNWLGEQVREKYHNDDAFENLVCITASKVRIIEIYNNLKAGKKLNKRGMVIIE